MTINQLFNLELEEIEHVKANAMASADSFTIDNLLPTTILDVDLTLGRDKVSEFAIVRDSENNHRVYPSEFSDFYKSTPATELASHGLSQRIKMSASAPDDVDLFFGYDESKENNGQSDSNTVSISRGMTASDVKSALDTLAANHSAFNEFTVLPSPGEDPAAPASWDVTFSNSLSDAATLGIRYHDPDKRVADYFYRYDLTKGGDYIFEDSEWVVTGDDIALSGGLPRLADQITPATRVPTQHSPENMFSQKLWLADGLEKVNLYYGYVDENTANFSESGEVVEIHSEMTTDEFQVQVNHLLSNNGFDADATVSGSGTAYDPWVITTDTEYTNLFAYHYKYQQYVGALASRDDTRVYEKFYRLNQSTPVEYHYNLDGSPKLINETSSIDGVEPNRVQFLSLQANEPYAILWYGNEGVGIHQNDILATYSVPSFPTALPSVTEIRDDLTAQLNASDDYSAIVKNNNILLVLTTDDAELTPTSSILSGIGVPVTGLGEVPEAKSQGFEVATITLSETLNPITNDVWKIKDGTIEIARAVATQTTNLDDIRSILISSLNQQQLLFMIQVKNQLTRKKF